MPWLDVSQVTLSPWLSDTFLVVQRRQDVDAGGIATALITSTITARGIVTPTGGNSLVREDAYAMQTQSIQVITKYQLRTAGTVPDGSGRMSDLIVWRNNTYLVKTLNSYLDFGAGFSVAECIMTDYNAALPVDDS